MIDKETISEVKDPEPELVEVTMPTVEEEPASIGEKSLPFVIMAIVILVDQFSKLYIEIWLPLNTSSAPYPTLAHIFQFTRVNNTGAAFGLFPSGSPIFMLVAVVVTIVIVIYNFKLPANHYLYRVAFGLQLGGALGNFIDRVRQVHVTDFLDFGPIPVSNVADISIVTGTILLAFLMFWDERKAIRSQQAEVESQTESGREQGEPPEDQNILWNE